MISVHIARSTLIFIAIKDSFGCNLFNFEFLRPYEALYGIMFVSLHILNDLGKHEFHYTTTDWTDSLL